MGDNINTTKRITEALIYASKNIGPEVNAEKAKSTSHYHSAG
jgi:hypothetical protein